MNINWNSEFAGMEILQARMAQEKGLAFKGDCMALLLPLFARGNYTATFIPAEIVRQSQTTTAQR